MRQLSSALQQLHADETGHVEVGVPNLIAGLGAIALGIGAASDSDVAMIVGGVVLGLGIFVSGVLRHRVIDYDVYSRLEKLEK